MIGGDHRVITQDRRSETSRTRVGETERARERERRQAWPVPLTEDLPGKQLERQSNRDTSLQPTEEPQPGARCWIDSAFLDRFTGFSVSILGVRYRFSSMCGVVIPLRGFMYYVYSVYTDAYRPPPRIEWLPLTRYGTVRREPLSDLKHG